MPSGASINCRLIDATEERPAMGTLVTLGKVQGRVVRHLDQGFAVELMRLQHPDFLEENVTGA
jgi:hypothetical protein